MAVTQCAFAELWPPLAAPIPVNTTDNGVVTVVGTTGALHSWVVVGKGGGWHLAGYVAPYVAPCRITREAQWGSAGSWPVDGRRPCCTQAPMLPSHRAPSQPTLPHLHLCTQLAPPLSLCWRSGPGCEEPGQGCAAPALHPLVPALYGESQVVCVSSRSSGSNGAWSLLRQPWRWHPGANSCN